MAELSIFCVINKHLGNFVSRTVILLNSCAGKYRRICLANIIVNCFPSSYKIIICLRPTVLHTPDIHIINGISKQVVPFEQNVNDAESRNINVEHIKHIIHSHFRILSFSESVRSGCKWSYGDNN